jgi:hypothetical protein
MFEKKSHFKDLNVLNMQRDLWFTLHFEHWSFASNGVYFKKNIDSPNYYAPCDFPNIWKYNFK